MKNFLEKVPIFLVLLVIQIEAILWYFWWEFTPTLGSFSVLTAMVIFCAPMLFIHEQDE